MPFIYALWVNNGKSGLSYMQFWVNRGSSDQKFLNQDIIHFENAINRVLHERSNITASLVEHLKFRE